MNARLLAALRTLRRVLADGLAALWRARGEHAVALLGFAGWFCLTRGVAALCGPVTWWFSLGLLSGSLVGWKLLGTIASQGLYALSQRKERP